jgi:hypothetical protein
MKMIGGSLNFRDYLDLRIPFQNRFEYESRSLIEHYRRYARPGWWTLRRWVELMWFSLLFPKMTLLIRNNRGIPEMDQNPTKVT